MANINDILFKPDNVQLKFRGTWNSASGVLPSTTAYPIGSVLQANADVTIATVFYKNKSFIFNNGGAWERGNTYEYNDLNNKPVLGSASALNATEAGEVFITLTSDTIMQNTARSYLGFTTIGSSIATAANENAVLTLLGIPTDLVSQLSNKQTRDDDLTAIAALSGTEGLLRKTALNTWALDTNIYLTENQIINFTGSVTGSGSTEVVLNLTETGVAEGTYTKVQVGLDGRILSGLNPTTLAGYGITDAAPISHIGAGGSSHALATGASHGFLSSTDFTKLEGVQEEATKNLPDADLLDLANHTGMLPQNKVTSLVTDLAARELLVNKVQDLSAPNPNTYISTQGLAAALAAIVSGQNYLGEWNSETNSPEIISSVGVEGDYYIVSVASSGVTIIDGEDVWNLGDKILFGDGTWKREPNYQLVSSVNGYTGPVVLNKNDIGLGNVDNTSDINKPVSTLQQSSLNTKENLSNKVSNLTAPNADTYPNTLAVSVALGNYLVGVASSVDNEIVLYSGTTGKATKRGSVVGNAAYATVVSSQTDTTANRLMNRTYIGIGVTGAETLANYSTFSAVPLINNLTAIVNAGAADAPSKLPSAAYRVEVNGSGSNWSQKAFARITGSTVTNEIFAWRSIISGDTWSAWRYPYDTGNVSTNVATMLASATNAQILTNIGAASSNNAVFTGTTSGETPVKGNSSTLFSTTEYVKTAGKFYSNLIGIAADTTLTSADVGKCFIVGTPCNITLPLVSSMFTNNTERRGSTLTFSIGYTSDISITTLICSGSDSIRDVDPLTDPAITLDLYSAERIELSCDSTSGWYVTNWVSRRPLKLEACPISDITDANLYIKNGSWLTPLTGLTNFPASIISANTRAILHVSGNVNSGVTQTVESRNSDGRRYHRSGQIANLVGLPWVEEWNTNNLVKVSSKSDTAVGSVLTTGYRGLGGSINGSGITWDAPNGGSFVDNANFNPSAITTTYFGITSGRFDNAFAIQFAGRDGKYYFRSIENSVVGTPVEAFHTGNTLNIGLTPATAKLALGLAAIASSGSASDLITGTINDLRLPTTMSAKTFTGNLTIQKSNPLISLIDSDSTAATATATYEFYDSVPTKIGHLGFVGSTTLNIRNDNATGEILISTAGGNSFASIGSGWNVKSRTSNISNLNFYGSANNYQGSIASTNSFIGLFSPADSSNPMIRAEGTTIYVRNQLMQGLGSGQLIHYLNGGASGTNAGAATYYQNNGVTTGAIGGYSAVLGGAYTASMLLYSTNSVYFQSGSATAMVMHPNQNISIGSTTDSGAAKLQITGAISATGNITSGGIFIGNGSLLTNLDASDLASGTVAVARLPSVSAYLGFTPVQQGTGIGQSANIVKIGWSVGSKLKATVDTTDLGNIALEPWVSANFASKYNTKQILQTLGNVSGTLTIDCNLGTHITCTLIGNTTLAFSNTVSSTESISITLEVTNPGNYTFTLPAGTRYTGGTAPSFTSNGVDVFVFTKAGTANFRFYMSSKDSK